MLVTFLFSLMAQDAPYKLSFVAKSREEEEEDEKIYKRYGEIVAKLPTTESWLGNLVYQYQGFWCNSAIGVGPLAAQDQFMAKPSDILLASTPKCGTTWLQSLAFAIMNRKSHPPSAQQYPLLIFNSYDLVPIMEKKLYSNNFNGNRIPKLDILPSPRLFSTHMPYTSLPQSVAHSDSRIVYICRNTKDNLVSWWLSINKIRSNNSLKPMTVEEAFDCFCRGVSSFGAFWDHVLGFWKGSLERPRNVLFLKYEEMLADPAHHLKRIADFMGCPFSSIEDREGVVVQIIKLCSLEILSNLAVNQTGTTYQGIPNSVFFRQGKVGESQYYLTPEMMEQLDCITEQKFHGLGLKL